MRTSDSLEGRWLQLWRDLVVAAQDLARCRAEFYVHAESRPETIARALEGGDSWDRSVAPATIVYDRTVTAAAHGLVSGADTTVGRRSDIRS